MPWELTIYKDGKRARSLHDTEAEALKVWQAHCRKLELHGKKGETLSREEIREFLEAKRIAGDEDLRDVVSFWRRQNPAEPPPTPARGSE